MNPKLLILALSGKVKGIEDPFERRRILTLMEFQQELINGVVNYRPASERVEINDKATKKIFALPVETFDSMMNGVAPTIDEAKIKGKVIKSQVRLALEEEKLIKFDAPLQALDEFDRAVMAACVSEIAAGNSFSTINVIYRNLTGKIGRGDAEPTKNQIEMIKRSLIKMNALTITLDYSNCMEVLNGAKFTTRDLTGSILPCQIMQGEINGKSTTILKFLDKIPLYLVAQAKKQILTYDGRLLDIPNQSNTPMNIMVKNHTIRRVMEIISHKELAPTIKFISAFKNCRILGKDNKIKQRARETMIELFEHLKENRIITSFSVAKDGNTFDSIKFKFKSKK